LSVLGGLIRTVGGLLAAVFGLLRGLLGGVGRLLKAVELESTLTQRFDPRTAPAARAGAPSDRAYGQERPHRPTEATSSAKIDGAFLAKSAFSQSTAVRCGTKRALVWSGLVWCD
jgi:hypothetical protein